MLAPMTWMLLHQIKTIRQGRNTIVESDKSTKVWRGLYDILPLRDLIYLMMSNIYVSSCIIQWSLTWKIWDAYYDIFRVPRNGLQLLKKNKMSLIAYSDANWASCPSTRRFSPGYCVFLGDYLISWSAKRQPIVSRSSAEAEYKGVANAVAEICLLWNLLVEMGCPLTQGSIVYCDNINAVYLSSNLFQHQPTKHIEIDIHFVCEKDQMGQMRVLHVPSSLQYPDIFTKGSDFHQNYSSASVPVWDSYHPTIKLLEGDSHLIIFLWILFFSLL